MFGLIGDFLAYNRQIRPLRRHLMCGENVRHPEPRSERNRRKMGIEELESLLQDMNEHKESTSGEFAVRFSLHALRPRRYHGAAGECVIEQAPVRSVVFYLWRAVVIALVQFA